jgi:Rps23 Pro-64 3,4-dihydroxylase Tpa1-like proline 4-hydroxylase
MPGAASAVVLGAAPSRRSARGGRETFESWNPSQYREHLHALAVASRGHYGFAYESYMMVRAYKEGRDPGLPLHGVLEFLNSPPFLAFARALTGHAGLRRVNAQATRYRAGHFLKRHNDFNATEGRQFAYVINLTRRWEADWGGLLQFLDAERRVVESFSPRWNTLSLFRVPAEHCVSLIAPWAEADRLAITGWFLA